MKALYLFLTIGLLYTPANAEIMWQVYVTKNNDKSSTQIVQVATSTTRIDLPGLPVKAELNPVAAGVSPEGVAFEARMMVFEFIEGSHVGFATVCPIGFPGRGNANSLLVHRYNMLYEVVLQCLEVPEIPK